MRFESVDSSAKPRKCGNQPSAGSTWTDATRTSSRSQKISCVPLPWCASTSRTATRPAVTAQRLGRDRGVVEVAGASVGGAADVMSRRAAQRVRVRRAGRDEIDGGQRGIDGSACGLPRPGADERHRVVGEVAGARPQPRRAPGEPESLRGRRRTGRRGAGRDRPGCRRRSTTPTPTRGRRRAPGRGPASSISSSCGWPARCRRAPRAARPPGRALPSRASRGRRRPPRPARASRQRSSHTIGIATIAADYMVGR